MDVRRHVRNLLIRNDLDTPVLSYQELVPEFSVQPLATITAQPEASAHAVESQLEPARRQAEHPEQRAAPAKVAVGAR
jgi:type III secretion protein V